MLSSEIPWINNALRHLYFLKIHIEPLGEKMPSSIFKTFINVNI